jgi:hypothetical protein
MVEAGSHLLGGGEVATRSSLLLLAIFQLLSSHRVAKKAISMGGGYVGRLESKRSIIHLKAFQFTY